MSQEQEAKRLKQIEWEIQNLQAVVRKRGALGPQGDRRRWAELLVSIALVAANGLVAYFAFDASKSAQRAESRAETAAGNAALLQAQALDALARLPSLVESAKEGAAGMGRLVEQQEEVQQENLQLQRVQGCVALDIDLARRTFVVERPRRCKVVAVWLYNPGISRRAEAGVRLGPPYSIDCALMHQFEEAPGGRSSRFDLHLSDCINQRLGAEGSGSARVEIHEKI